MRVQFCLVILGALGCSSENGSLNSPPHPPPTYETVCRCGDRMWPLAVVRVESSSTPFDDERYSIERSGVDYDVVVERVLPTGRGAESALVPSARVRGRQYLTHSGGQLILAGTQADHPQYTRVERGMRLLAHLSGPDPDDPNRWSLSILATIPMSDAMPRRLFSFPSGTPVSQVLDPAEWTCTPDRPQRGDCPPPDGGVRDATSD